MIQFDRVYWVQCDAYDCVECTDDDLRSYEVDADRVALAAGWTKGGSDEHFCPEHSRRAES